MNKLEEEALDLIFRNARTYNGWLDKPVTDDLLREMYEVMKWGPTSANSTPARFLFLRTKEARERLRAALSPGNVDKTMAAPVTVIVAYDTKFHEKLPRLFPHNPKMSQFFAGNAQFAEVTAMRNSTLQGAYMIVAARSLGLDCGPMSGFDNAKVDEEFFSGQRGDCPEEFFPAGSVKSNFLCNLGYGDPATLFPRSPRLEFNEACCLI